MAAFDIKVVPTVTNGAYSAGDIMGALLTFDTGMAKNKLILLNKVVITIKAAVTPALTLHLFDADPTSTTKTDNAAYSLNAADAFKLIDSYAVADAVVDHGTPNSYRIADINDVIRPAADSAIFYGLLVDGTGVTLTSTGDVQLRASGFQAS